MHKPLEGMRVLDLSRVLAGPWASQTLADLGADVIKIERPGVGDDTRSWGPPYAKKPDGTDSSEAAYFLAANRGKRSVAIDIASAEGQALVSALAERSDIVIENFKVGALARYGLDYQTLATLNPRLIYCSITGFGQSGPYADRPGYDFMIQGLGGLMSISGNPDGAPGSGPMKTGVAVADLVSGLYATIAILAAVTGRAKTGYGTHIDISLLDCQVAMLANQAMNYLTTGTSPGRLGNAHPNIVPYEAFATADSHVIVAVGNDMQFAAFARIAGHDDWAVDPRFATNPARVANRTLLTAQIAAVMKERTSAVWLKDLTGAGVPCGPINDLASVFADPHVIARGLNVTLPHPEAGQVPGVANPIRFDEQSQTSQLAPPRLGNDTAAVLAEHLGLNARDIAALRQRGVI